MTLRSTMLCAIALTALSSSAALAYDYGNSSTKIAANAMTPSKPVAAPSQRTTRKGVLTDAKGMTLYTYDKDTAGVPTCTGACAIAWPPAKAPKGAKASGGMTVIAARGGNFWAYNGHPLYRYAKDRKPGDVTGDGVGGVWHAAMK
jgi:predicted lipoprotein with Yx(FWY)xxD motif